MVVLLRGWEPVADPAYLAVAEGHRAPQRPGLGSQRSAKVAETHQGHLGSELDWRQELDHHADLRWRWGGEERAREVVRDPESHWDAALADAARQHRAGDHHSQYRVAAPYHGRRALHAGLKRVGDLLDELEPSHLVGVGDY
jgi:hypothetical protein